MRQTYLLVALRGLGILAGSVAGAYLAAKNLPAGELIATCVVAGSGAFVGFLDQSLGAAKLQADLESNRTIALPSAGGQP